jgi:hypothetical protein
VLGLAAKKNGAAYAEISDAALVTCTMLTFALKSAFLVRATALAPELIADSGPKLAFSIVPDGRHAPPDCWSLGSGVSREVRI